MLNNYKMSSKQAIILFTKNPELGKVKTRLATTIGDEKALAIYKKLLQHTREIVTPLEVDKILFYSDTIIQNDNWSTAIFMKKVQVGNDLGERMNHAFQMVFNLGYESACIIGSDCYELNTTIIAEAFESIKRKNMVIGPTFDGGYYLLGMNKLHSSIFKNIEWSTETVFDDTMKEVENLNLSSHILTKLTDIDEEKNLPQHWK